MLSSKLQLTLRDRKVLAAICALIILVSGVSVGIGYQLGTKAQSSTLTMQTHSGGPYPGAPSYTFFVEAGTYYTKDANGAITSSTNASSILQSTINILTNGGLIHFNKGSFSFTNTITITYGHITFEGEGVGSDAYPPSNLEGTALYLDSSENKVLFTSTSKNYITFKDMVISGTQATGTKTNNIFTVNGGSYWQFDNVIVRDAGQDCISLVNGEAWTFQDSTFSYAKRYGLYLESGGNHELFNLYIGNNANNGLVFGPGTQYNDVNHCEIASNGGNGIYAVTDKNDVIRNSHIIWNNQNGVNLDRSVGIRIEGNTIESNGANATNTFDGIVAGGYSGTVTSNGIITSNRVTNYVGYLTQRYSIRLASDAVNYTICNNDVSGNLNEMSLSGNWTIVENNIGYKTVAKGNAVGTSPITIAHGLVTAPTYVLTSPMDGATLETSWTADTTNIYIYHNGGSSRTISYYAEAVIAP